MTTRTRAFAWSLPCVAAALALSGCADVSGGKSGALPQVGGPTLDPKNEEGIVCQSIREAMQADRAAYDKAVAAGDKAGAAGKLDAVRAGAQGAMSVKGCTVADLLPAAAGPVVSPTAS